MVLVDRNVCVCVCLGTSAMGPLGHVSGGSEVDLYVEAVHAGGESGFGGSCEPWYWTGC